jgi:hypothetical protein
MTALRASHFFTLNVCDLRIAWLNLRASDRNLETFYTLNQRSFAWFNRLSTLGGPDFTVHAYFPDRSDPFDDLSRLTYHSGRSQRRLPALGLDDQVADGQYGGA